MSNEFDSTQEEVAIPDWIFNEENELVPDYLFSEPRTFSPHFDSYQRWLTEHGLPPHTIPTPVRPFLTQGYNEWRNLHPEQQPDKSKLHDVIVAGHFPCYGLVDLEDDDWDPIYGPLELDDDYPYVDDYGIGFNQAFNEKLQDYQQLMSNKNFLFNDLIKQITNNRFESQVWNVWQGQYYECAAKVKAARYIYDTMHGLRTTKKMVTLLEKEAKILVMLKHNNIVTVIECFNLGDFATGFPFLFNVIVMEKMQGDCESFIQQYHTIPEYTARSLLYQIGQALDYLHNHLVKYVIVHQDIQTTNILWKLISGPNEDKQQYLFQLCGFGKAIVYDSELARATPSIPIDILPFDDSDVEYQVHCHRYSSKEYWAALDFSPLRLCLRTMPNDVYCLAAVVIELWEGRWSGPFDDVFPDRPSDRMRDKLKRLSCWPLCNTLDKVLKLMTIKDPEERITFSNLFSHPLFLSMFRNDYVPKGVM